MLLSSSSSSCRAERPQAQARPCRQCVSSWRLRTPDQTPRDARRHGRSVRRWPGRQASDPAPGRGGRQPHRRRRGAAAAAGVKARERKKVEKESRDQDPRVSLAPPCRASFVQSAAAAFTASKCPAGDPTARKRRQGAPREQVRRTHGRRERCSRFGLVLLPLALSLSLAAPGSLPALARLGGSLQPEWMCSAGSAPARGNPRGCGCGCDAVVGGVARQNLSLLSPS